jgi:hypothetical protein
MTLYSLTNATQLGKNPLIPIKMKTITKMIKKISNKISDKALKKILKKMIPKETKTTIPLFLSLKSLLLQTIPTLSLKRKFESPQFDY